MENTRLNLTCPENFYKISDACNNTPNSKDWSYHRGRTTSFTRRTNWFQRFEFPPKKRKILLEEQIGHE